MTLKLAKEPTSKTHYEHNQDSHPDLFVGIGFDDVCNSEDCSEKRHSGRRNVPLLLFCKPQFLKSGRPVFVFKSGCPVFVFQAATQPPKLLDEAVFVLLVTHGSPSSPA